MAMRNVPQEEIASPVARRVFPTWVVREDLRALGGGVEGDGVGSWWEDLVATRKT